MVPCVVRTRSRSLYRSKIRTVATAGGEGREKGANRAEKEREEGEEWSVERLPRQQWRNKAIALKETEADLRAPWH